MSGYEGLFSEVKIPNFYRIKRNFSNRRIDDVESKVKDELVQTGVLDQIKCGQIVALTAGSREIANYALIIKVVCDTIKARGAKPFIFPAMGSHGGSIAKNQQDLIAHYGITEEAMGVPILSSMETVCLGKTDEGIPVYFDKHASGADAVIPIGRVKYHTCFHGETESGLMKMLAVGCGKQKGAAAMHELGFPSMSKNVTAVARVVLDKVPVLFGVGIVENAEHQTAEIKVIPASGIEEEEKKLLCLSKSYLMKLPFKKIDILIVNEIGKNISGVCMDPNITGRSSPFGTLEPFVEKLVALDLTSQSDGNAYGVGNADIITKKLFDKIILENTYPNGITNHDLKPMMIPAIMPSDLDAIRMSICTLLKNDPQNGPRIVWIHNTLILDEILCSESLLQQAQLIENAQIDTKPIAMMFQQNGMLYSKVFKY